MVKILYYRSDNVRAIAEWMNNLESDIIMFQIIETERESHTEYPNSNDYRKEVGAIFECVVLVYEIYSTKKSDIREMEEVFYHEQNG